MNVKGKQQAGSFLSRVPGQQPKTAIKEKKQAELSPVTPHHRAPKQNTRIEDPLSLYDDGSLDGVSDEEGRYIVYFHNIIPNLPRTAAQLISTDFIRSLL